MNVHSSCTTVNAECTLTAGARAEPVCNPRRMNRSHPRRPHLKAWREHFRKTLEWVADQVQTSHTSVMRWERGTSGVDDATFAAIAKAYGITPAELSAPPSEAERARQMHRLMTRLKNLDAKALTSLADLADQLDRPR